MNGLLPPCLAWALLALADAATTTAGLSRGAVEANPMQRSILVWLGSPWPAAILFLFLVPVVVFGMAHAMPSMRSVVTTAAWLAAAARAGAVASNCLWLHAHGGLL